MTGAGKLDRAAVSALASRSTDRIGLVLDIMKSVRPSVVAEIGVWKGDFASAALEACPWIERYYMIDPWRPLASWNKPLNTTPDEFSTAYEEAMRRTEFASERRVVLRGTTAEVGDTIPDASLDFAYVDGDHTLRGIVIDLVTMAAKVRLGGLIAGDDFSPTIWQHGPTFEPTLVWPVAVHFAEATGNRIYGLPREQFLLCNDAGLGGHEFIDLVDGYGTPELLPQVIPRAPSSRSQRSEG